MVLALCVERCTAPCWKADELRIPFMYVPPSQDENFCGLPAYELTVPDTKMGISAEN